MDQLITYIILFSIIVILGQLFQKTTIPLPLVLVIFGMLISFIPFVPEIQLNPNLVLEVFLPMLIYQISAFSSWHDIRKQIWPIASLSIGHVIFITVLVAIVIHTLIPQMGWALAFVLGAVISPPDDVAIVSIREKVLIPDRIFTILEGEAMFNDAAALTLFRFALAAAITQKFSAVPAVSAFIAMVFGEIVYGLLIGHLIGKIRQKMTNTSLHLILTFMTPFLAYLPPSLLGGTGIISTAIVGFLIGNLYSVRFMPEYRIISIGIWPSLAFAIQSLIFLLVGLDLRSIVMRISSIPPVNLLIYVSAVIAVVIIGRFIWVYGSIEFISRFVLSPHERKMYPGWRGKFLVSWAGMRGGISLAAALAMPALLFQADGVDVRDLVLFIVFCLIIVTLIFQGFSLPFIIRKLGFEKIGQKERYKEHLSELAAKAKMIHQGLKWLRQYRKEIKENDKLYDEVTYHIHEHKSLEKQYKNRIADHHDEAFHDEALEVKGSVSLLLQVIKIEKEEVLRLWQEEKINLRTRNKLLALLDHQAQRFLV